VVQRSRRRLDRGTAAASSATSSATSWTAVLTSYLRLMVSAAPSRCRRSPLSIRLAEGSRRPKLAGAAGPLSPRSGRVKKRPIRAGRRLPSLAGPSPPLAARSTLAIPTCPRGRRGQGVVVNWRPLGSRRPNSVRGLPVCIGPCASARAAGLSPVEGRLAVGVSASSCTEGDPLLPSATVARFFALRVDTRAATMVPHPSFSRAMAYASTKEPPRKVSWR
jgi:hypothetical protein